MEERRFYGSRRITDKKPVVHERRAAIMGIVVENKKDIGKLNDLLGEYSKYILGRMGIPRAGENDAYSLISVALDAPEHIICALSGKVGMISGIRSKVIYAPSKQEEKKKPKKQETD